MLAKLKPHAVLKFHPQVASAQSLKYSVALLRKMAPESVSVLSCKNTFPGEDGEKPGPVRGLRPRSRPSAAWSQCCSGPVSSYGSALLIAFARWRTLIDIDKYCRALHVCCWSSDGKRQPSHFYAMAFWCSIDAQFLFHEAGPTVLIGRCLLRAGCVYPGEYELKSSRVPLQRSVRGKDHRRRSVSSAKHGRPMQ
jgi:hypothetical protein